MSSTELAVREPIDVDELGRVAKMLALSGYFKTTGNLDVAVAQMAVKVLAGREMGFGPFASATGIEIIQGRPAVGARLIAAAIKANPRYNYRIRRADAEECTIEFFENNESVGKATYTIAEAKAAGLAGKDNWKGYPSDMLFARCISRGQRRFCPDVFSGATVYTPEELGATVDVDGVIMEQIEPEPPPANGNGRKVEPAGDAAEDWDDTFATMQDYPAAKMWAFNLQPARFAHPKHLEAAWSQVFKEHEGHKAENASAFLDAWRKYVLAHEAEGSGK